MAANTRQSSLRTTASAGIEKPRSSRGRPTTRETNPGARPRTTRGRGRGRGPNRAPASDQRAQLAKQALQSGLQAEANPSRPQQDAAPVETRKQVARISNGPWKSTPLSLYFVQRGQLENSPDAETIALNLIDFLLSESNWDPRLRMNILAASCFFFACSLTGLSNQASDIARSFEADLDSNANAWMAYLVARNVQVADVATMRTRLRLTASDVEGGYAILWNMRNAFREILGDYAETLETLSKPRGYSVLLLECSEAGQEKEQEEKQNEEAAASSSESSTEVHETAAEEQLPPKVELVELDDFETSIEDYES